MLKKLISALISVTILFSSPLMIRAQENESNKMDGISIDCSNRYFTVSQIEKYITLISEKEGNNTGYLQLHLTGDSNVGIECRTLGQIATEKYKRGKSEYYNPKTGKSFLSYGQIQEILKYADNKKVKVIPEIDMPGHMGGFAKLYKSKYGSKKTTLLFGTDNDSLQINQMAAVRFSRSIYDEYAGLFKKCEYFHIGCDEFWDGEPDENMNYINQTAAYLQNKGFRIMVWNDLITRQNLNHLGKNIIVTYWSWDGDTDSDDEKKERQETRASLPDLQHAGIKVINYNSYYLYYVPSPADTKKDDQYMVHDLSDNWNIGNWNSDTGNETSPDGIIGAAISVWTEESSGIPLERIYKNTKNLFCAMQYKL